MMDISAMSAPSGTTCAYLVMARAQAFGIVLTLPGDGPVHIGPASRMPANLMEDLCRLKPAVVELLSLRTAEPRRLDAHEPAP